MKANSKGCNKFVVFKNTVAGNGRTKFLTKLSPLPRLHDVSDQFVIRGFVVFFQNA